MKNLLIGLLVILILLALSIQCHAENGKLVDSGEKWVNEAFNLESVKDSVNPESAKDFDFGVDKLTLLLFRDMKKSLSELSFSVEYSSKIVCDNDFGNIVLTIYNGNSASRNLVRYKVYKSISQNAHRLYFDLYVEVVSPNISYRKLFFKAGGSDKIQFISYSDASGEDHLNAYFNRKSYPSYTDRCLVCGGGSIFTKYGRKSHAYGCQYTRIGIRKNTLSTTNTRKYPNIKKSSKGGTIKVRGYYRKDGTYVKPHTRRRRK